MSSSSISSALSFRFDEVLVVCETAEEAELFALAAAVIILVVLTVELAPLAAARARVTRFGGDSMAAK
jgi:hypothetical protein